MQQAQIRTPLDSRLRGNDALPFFRPLPSLPPNQGSQHHPLSRKRERVRVRDDEQQQSAKKPTQRKLQITSHPKTPISLPQRPSSPPPFSRLREKGAKTNRENNDRRSCEEPALECLSRGQEPSVVAFEVAFEVAVALNPLLRRQ